MEARSDLLFQGGIRQQIASQALDRKLVEWLVGIESPDDPVAVGPHFAIVVKVHAVRVGVPRVVQPVAAAVLTPALRRQQSIHELFIRVRRSVFQERLHDLRRWGQPGQVQAHPADQCRPIGLRGRFESHRFQAGQDEVVDGVPDPIRTLNRRRRGALRGYERPV